MNATRTCTFKTRLTVATCLLACTLGASAQDMRTLKQSIEIDAPVQLVWELFSTEEGLKQWMAPLVELDFRVGGTIKSSYQADGTIGDENTITNTILVYDPGLMLALKATGAPQGFPYADAIKDTWSVFHFEPLGENRMRLRLHGHGYRDNPDSVAMYKFFERGNEWALQQLKELAEAGNDTDRNTDQADAELDEILDEARGSAVQSDTTLELLHTLIGGSWRHDMHSTDGSTFRVRNEILLGPDRHSLIMHGWQDRGEGMKPHAVTTAYRLPTSEGGGIGFLCVDETGSLTRGRITLGHEESTLIWDWPAITLAGETQHYRIEMRLDGDDHYVMNMSKLDADGAVAKRWPSIPFTRGK
ncbi:MAG: SRPBCC domain-containing protein [Planctomycetota bacterium]|nr:SRPBCC domain-containing protein [Planctomycetota bacterium]